MPNRSRMLVSALLCVSMLLAVTASPAHAVVLKKGIYDCNGTQSGYVNSVKVMSGGRYIFASSREGAQLRSTTRGRYRFNGKRIFWLSGVYKRGNYVSTLYKSSTDTYFSIDRKRDNIWTGISCYFTPRSELGGTPG